MVSAITNLKHMKKSIHHGFFCQQDVNTVATLKDLGSAKQYALSKIHEYSLQHPGVLSENVVKAQNAVSTARSINSLIFTLQNFVLAHPSEGLRVI